MKAKPLHSLITSALAVAILMMGLCVTLPMARGDGVVQQWVTRFNGLWNGNDFPVAVTVDTAGNVIVAGISYSGSSNPDYYVAKYAAADGQLLWQQFYNGPADREDEAAALVLDAGGNAIVTGSSRNPSGYFNIYTAKYAAANGALLWETHRSFSKNETANAIAVDASGNAIVAGYSGSDCYTVKYAAANGAQLWEKRHNESGIYSDSAKAVVVQGNGDVIVTGESYNANKNPDIYTAKYAGGNGALVWERRYAGPNNRGEGGQAVVVDGSGNVAITGYSAGSGSDGSFYTAKYAAASGAILWERSYNTSTNNQYDRRAVAMDSAGNVIVGGRTGIGPNLYTAKYAAADGAMLWERRHDSTSDYSTSYSLAVDAGGNVVVAGITYDSQTKANFYTAKYTAAEGALLWEKIYDGPDRLFDSGTYLALTPDGGVAITGYSYSDPGLTRDFATVKYAPVETTTVGAQQVTPTVMQFHGTANPGGIVTIASFEWGTTPALGHVTLAKDLGSGASSVAVTNQASGVPAGATIYFRIRSDSNEGTNYGRILSTTNFIPLATWKQLHLGDANAPDLGDPEGDGLATLAEYGLGFLPATPNTAPAATLFDYAEGRRLRMFVQRDPAHNEAIVEVQAAGAPDGPWATVALSNLGKPFAGPGYVGGDSLTPGLKAVEVRDIVNVSSAGQRFMRVRVTR